MIKHLTALFTTAVASTSLLSSDFRVLQEVPATPAPAFEGVKVQSVGITDSASCVQECIGKDNIFCRYAADKSKGNCCIPTDY